MALDIPTIVFSLLTGSLAGAITGSVLTSRFNANRAKVDIALDAIEFYMSIYSELAIVQSLLQGKQITDPAEQNRVRKVGDWLELICTLSKNGAVEVGYLNQVGIHNQVRNFHNNLNGYNSRGNNEFSSAWQWWPTIPTMAGNTQLVRG